MSNVVYGNLISIGQNCQVKHNILRKLWIDRFGSDSGFSVNNDAFSREEAGTYFFDWSWTKTPVESVRQIVTSGFTGYFERERLEIVRISDGREEVLDTATGLRYPHEFARDINGRVLPKTLDERYSAVRGKLVYLAQKTQRTLSESVGPILFVFYADVTYSEVEQLSEVFERSHPRLDFRLLWVTTVTQPRLSDRKRIIHRVVGNRPYPGDLGGWLDAFRGIEYRLAR